MIISNEGIEVESGDCKMELAKPGDDRDFRRWILGRGICHSCKWLKLILILIKPISSAFFWIWGLRNAIFTSLNVFFHYSIQSRGCHVQCIQRRRSRNSFNYTKFLGTPQVLFFFFFFIYLLLFVCFNQLRWYTYTKDFLEESICCDGPYHVYNSLNYDVMDTLKIWWFYIILSKYVMWWCYRTVIVTFCF